MKDGKGGERGEGYPLLDLPLVRGAHVLAIHNVFSPEGGLLNSVLRKRSEKLTLYAVSSCCAPPSSASCPGEGGGDVVRELSPSSNPVGCLSAIASTPSTTAHVES